MRFNTIVPILYATDVAKSIAHFTDVLAFEDKWLWGHPPTFGGIFRNGVEIFFCKDDQGNPGTWLSIMVDDVDEYFEIIRSNGATIVSEPKTMEWGVREMLVKVPDGHFIRFGHSAAHRKKSEKEMPVTVRIEERMPTVTELQRLVTAVGWAQPGEKAPPEIPLSSIALVVVAVDTIKNDVIGCAFLLTDQAGFYYVKNVIVHPAWQGKRVGTALMKKLNDWLDLYATDHAMVALHTGEYLAPFYRQFGFNRSFSMQKNIRRPKK
jgi:GNAT superfamily N-acetyltransferase